jgi:hypothetical protein
MSLSLFTLSCLLITPVFHWWMLLLRYVIRRLFFRMLAFYSLLLSWLLTLRLVALRLFIQLLQCHWLLLRLFLLLLMVRVLVFTVITVVKTDMWRHSTTERKKLRRLRLTVMVVLVLEDLRGVLLVQIHRRFLCFFFILWLLRQQELLVL